MRISDYKNEDAIDLLADLLEPASKIFADKDVVKALTGQGDRIKLAKTCLKKHKASIIQILARVNNVTIEEYDVNAVRVITDIIELFNDEVLVDFFAKQGQMDTK